LYQEVTVVYAKDRKVAEHSHDVLIVIDDAVTNFQVGAPLLTEAERQQIAAWNATERPYSQDRSVPQLVAAQAVAWPDAVALVADGQSLRYEELNRRANQLAHYLQALGVGPNVRVSLCMERSFDMVIGLLGILKAGGAYVPLDPTYPSERLAFMMGDAESHVLVTHHDIEVRLPNPAGQVVSMDTHAAVLAKQGTTDPISAATIDDLAYVIYTSGSTGRPKGVQITHNSLLNLIFWHQRTFSVVPAARATQLTSPAFDATGWELWPYLTAGASVYLANDMLRMEPLALRDWLVDQDITISFVPTALAESLITLEWPSTTRLRYLLTGADKLHRYPPSTLPFKLINNYGPTEATVLVTSGEVPPTEHPDVLPSIGSPVDNTQIYILDEQLQQVPIGEVGELCISGVGLALGYLNLPEQTAERFIAHPLSQKTGARLYKTGDLARYLPDGQIAFVGRIDHQIKIRGYRIEPGEIIAALNRHPAIQTSFVIAREDDAGDKRLIAYIVLVDDVPVTASSLRDALLTALPEYMIPASFVVIDALPITPNGKVDRDALPDPDTMNILSDEIITLPSTLTEERVARITYDLLGIEQIDIDANFFMLGGHSLLGTQLIARVAHTFGIDIPLRTLFEAPTIRTLSEQIEQRILARVQEMSDDEVQQLLL